MLTLTFANRHRTQQADMLVPYDAADAGREDGQQTVVEWRYRADSGDPWGAPTINIVDTPATASYTAPAAGWVQVTCYSIRDGITSWQQHVGEFAVDGSGDLAVPEPYADELDDPYVDELGATYMDKD